MGEGRAVIYQAAFLQTEGGVAWRGYVDFLRRVETPSALGAWSYEPWDTNSVRVRYSYGGPLKEDKGSTGKMKWVPAAADASEFLGMWLKRRGLQGATAEDLVFPAPVAEQQAARHLGRLPQGAHRGLLGCRRQGLQGGAHGVSGDPAQLGHAEPRGVRVAGRGQRGGRAFEPGGHEAVLRPPRMAIVLGYSNGATTKHVSDAEAAHKEARCSDIP